jgi:hypothetical protein
MKHVFNEIKKRPVAYLFLLLFFIVGAIFYLTFSYNIYIQKWIVSVTIAVYFIWSLYHHYKRGDLHFSIVLEYLIFGLFAAVLLSSTIF